MRISIRITKYRPSCVFLDKCSNWITQILSIVYQPIKNLKFAVGMFRFLQLSKVRVIKII